MDPFTFFLGLTPLIGTLLQSNQSNQAVNVSRENTDKTILANKQLAEYAYSRDLAMWNRANAYNLPSAQMDRLRQAGLNPMLMYGTGSSVATGNTSSTMPKYQAPTLEYKYAPPNMDWQGAMSAFQNVRMMTAQVDNVKAQTAVHIQDAANRTIEQALKIIELKYADDQKRGESEQSLAKGKSETINAAYQASVKALEVLQAKANLAWTDVQTESGKIGQEKARQDIVAGKLQMDKTMQEIATGRLTQDEIRTRISEMLERTAKTKSDKELTYYEKELKRLEMQYRKELGIYQGDLPWYAKKFYESGKRFENSSDSFLRWLREKMPRGSRFR